MELADETDGERTHYWGDYRGMIPISEIIATAERWNSVVVRNRSREGDIVLAQSGVTLVIRPTDGRGKVLVAGSIEQQPPEETDVVHVEIPEGVAAIGSAAFDGCEHLGGVTIPNGVTTIDPDAFFGCENLTSAVLPEGLQTIGDRAFANCVNLARIELPAGLISIGESAFRSCRSLANLIIPDGVTVIARETFAHCYNLMTATIPESVTKLDEKSFYDCVRLTSITIPDSVTEIGRLSFAGCTNLKHAMFSKSISKLGTDVFGVKHVPDLMSGYLAGIDLAEWPPEARVVLAICYLSTAESHDEQSKAMYEDYVRKHRKMIIAKIMEQQNLPVLESLLRMGLFSVRKIDEYIEAASKAQSVDMLALLMNHKNTFFSAEDIEKECYLKITSNPYSIAEMKKLWSFEPRPNGAYAITEYRGKEANVEIPEVIGKRLVTEIGDRAFWGCASLTSITIPDTVTAIGDGAFCNCTNLIRVSIPESVTVIGSHAFYGCRSLQEITIPDSVKEIGEYALGGFIRPTLRTTEGSCAHRYAHANDVHFVLD